MLAALQMIFGIAPLLVLGFVIEGNPACFQWIPWRYSACSTSLCLVRCSRFYLSTGSCCDAQWQDCKVSRLSLRLGSDARLVVG
jgi:hypothetical protein